MVFMDGNSFACVHATRRTLQFMLRGVRCRESLLDCFRSAAVAQYHMEPDALPKKPAKFGWKRAAIFPFQKEMHSLIRYAASLPFAITHVYDLRYAGHVGATTDARSICWEIG